MPHATKTYQNLLLSLTSKAPVDYRKVPAGSLVLGDIGVFLTTEDATVFPKGWGTLDGKLIFADPKDATACDWADEDILSFPAVDPKPVHHLPPGSFNLDELLFQHGFEAADLAIAKAAANPAQQKAALGLAKKVLKAKNTAPTKKAA